MLGEILLSLVVEEIVEILPVEDEFDEAAVLEGSQEGADVNIGDIGSLVGLSGEVLVENNHSFLKKISINCLFL